MTQLIINEYALPEVSHDAYSAERVPQGKILTMASGRTVTELAYEKWKIIYACDYLKPDMMRQLMSDLRFGNRVSVRFLPPDSDDLLAAVFICTARPMPTYAFSRDGTPFWHDIKFTLEGVEPI
jgi:hypothetical protein